MHEFHMGRSCPQRLGVGYKHNLRAPDDLMLRRDHDQDELKLLPGPSKERERLGRRDLDSYC